MVLMDKVSYVEEYDRQSVIKSIQDEMINSARDAIISEGRNIERESMTGVSFTSSEIGKRFSDAANRAIMSVLDKYTKAVAPSGVSAAPSAMQVMMVGNKKYFVPAPAPVYAVVTPALAGQRISVPAGAGGLPLIEPLAEIAAAGAIDIVDNAITGTITTTVQTGGKVVSDIVSTAINALFGVSSIG